MKYTGPKCRLCRREGMKLFLKGDKCDTQKCLFTRRNSAPGQHPKTMGKPTEYARQLREKQKAKRLYNVTEAQFVNYYNKAVRKKGAITGDLLIQLLETRLDNVLYRSGIADSRSQARQYVSHGLFKVNGRRVTIASFQVKPGDVFELVEKYKNSPNFLKAKADKVKTPGWLSFDMKSCKGTMEREIAKGELPAEVNPQIIVEFYSR